MFASACHRGLQYGRIQHHGNIMPIGERRPSTAVRVGRVTIGGNAPIVVQSMTNTDTADVEGTFRQVRELARKRAPSSCG